MEEKTIAIRNQAGQEYWLNYADGVLSTGGDMPMTEAAVIFFNEVKRIAKLDKS